MEEQKSLQERVKDTVIEYAKQYKDYFVDYDYLICSDVFQNADYYIVRLLMTARPARRSANSGITKLTSRIFNTSRL